MWKLKKMEMLFKQYSQNWIIRQTSKTVLSMWQHLKVTFFGKNLNNIY